jgi:hypothetical protein
VDNVKGRTAAFATFSPFRSHWSRFEERVALFFAPTRDAAARKPEFLHTAHFSRVSPRQLRRAGLWSDNLRHGALLFISAYNGDPESYFRGFNKELYAVMDEVWSRCVEWEGAQDFNDLNTFIQKFCRRSNMFFNAYPDQSKRIRKSLVLRRQLDKLLALARSDASQAEFKHAFDRTAQLHWGNQPLTRDDQ